MQILVVVASTRLRALRTDVEKGSSSTAFERGLVGPKPPANAFSRAWRDKTHFVPFHSPFRGGGGSLACALIFFSLARTMIGRRRQGEAKPPHMLYTFLKFLWQVLPIKSSKNAYVNVHYSFQRYNKNIIYDGVSVPKKKSCPPSFVLFL